MITARNNAMEPNQCSEPPTGTGEARILQWTTVTDPFHDELQMRGDSCGCRDTGSTSNSNSMLCATALILALCMTATLIVLMGCLSYMINRFLGLKPRRVLTGEGAAKRGQASKRIRGLGFAQSPTIDIFRDYNS